MKIEKKQIVLGGILTTVILVVILALFLGQNIFNPQVEDQSESLVEDNIPEEDLEDPEEDTTEEIPTPIRSKLSLKALAQSEFGIEPNTDFILESDEAIKMADFEGLIHIEPEHSFTLTQKTDQQILLSLDQEILPASLLRISLKQDGPKVGWAFQTQKVFGVEHTLPRADATGLAINSGIELYFTKTVAENIQDYFTIEPKVEGSFEYLNERVIFIPNEALKNKSTYKVTIKEGFGGDKEKLEEDYSFQFTTESKGWREHFAFKKTSTIFHEDKAQGFSIYLYGDEFKGKMAQTTIYQLVNSETYKRALGDYYDQDFVDQDSDQIINLEGFNQLIQFEDQVEVIDEYWYEMGYVGLPENLSKGFYLVQMTINEKTEYQFIQVTDYNAYASYDADQVLVWAVDVVGDKPVAEADVFVDGNRLGTTDQSGVYLGDFDMEEVEETKFIDMTTGDNETIIIDMNPNDGNWYDDYYYEYDYYDVDFSSKDYWSFLYTDRSIYRPNDHIEVFGVAKAKSDKDLNQVRVELVYQDTLLAVSQLEISATGSYTTSFDLEDFQYGYFYVKVYDGDVLIASQYASVGTFRLPSYKLSAQLDKDYLMLGESLELTVETTLFEGTPQPKAAIEVQTYNVETDLRQKLFEGNNYGISVLNFTPIVLGESGWRPTQGYAYVESAEVQDYFTSVSKRFTLFPRDLMVEVESDVVDDRTLNLSLNLHEIVLEEGLDNWYTPDNYRGDPVVDKMITVEVTAIHYEKVFIEKKYDYINKKHYDVYDYNRISENLGTYEVITDALGQGTFTLTDMKEDHNYELKLVTDDLQGRKVTEYYQHNNRMNRYISYIDNHYALSVNTDKYSYRSQDTIEAYIGYYGDYLGDTESSFALFFTCAQGIQSYQFADDLSTSFKFDQAFIPSGRVKGVYFDGENLINVSDQFFSYDQEERKLSIEAISNKTTYLPGEVADLTVKLTNDKGEAVKGEVNINIVDESLLEVYPNYADILEELYTDQYDDGILFEKVMTSDSILDRMDSMAEGGEGGDEDALRSNLQYTAHFESIQTDENGVGSTSFVLPDNLTSWNIALKAFSDQLYAGQTSTSIRTKMAAFLTMTLFDTYISGDTIQVGLRALGEDMREADQIQYKVLVYDESGQETSYESLGVGQVFDYINLGKLDEGTYEIQAYLYNRDGLVLDGLAKTIEVKDTIQYFEAKSLLPLDEDFMITHNNNLVHLNLVNRDSANYYNSLMSFYYGRNIERSDAISAAYEAGMAINSIFDRDLDLSFVDDLSSFRNQGLYSDLNYGTGMASYTSKALLLQRNREHHSDEELADIRYALLRDMDVSYLTSEEQWAGMWSLSMLSEPILIEINQRANDESILTGPLNYDKVYYLLSMIEMGDYAIAKDYFDTLRRSFVKESSHGYYVEGDDGRALSALMMVAASKLGHREIATSFYEHLNLSKDLYTSTLVERLYYLLHKEPIESVASVTYEVDNKKTSLSLDHKTVERIGLKPDQANQIKFEDINGNISVVTEFIGTVEDMELDESIGITRSYKVDGVLVDNGQINVGDIVEVELHLVCEGNTSLSIDEILPSGLVFKHYEYQNGVYPYYDVMGNQLSIDVYLKEEQATIRYKAVATVKGDYVSDYIVIKRRFGTGMNYGPRKEIRIQ